MNIDEIDRFNKKNINYKQLIIIGLIVVIIVFIILLTVKMIKKNKLMAEADGKPIITDSVEIESIENKTREVIDSINYLNQVFSSDKYDLSTEYTNSENLKCSKYVGENSDIYINIARTIYENPFSDKGYLDVKVNGEQEELYVCNSACNSSSINLADVKIVKENSDNMKTISINEKSYILKRINDMWKFSEPIVLCSND